MDKLLEFGRKALFYVRVLSGYEERRIRSYRLQLQNRLEQLSMHRSLPTNEEDKHFKVGLAHLAQERKAALKKIPEQVILSEVRRMVDEMQALNKKLEETEAAIENYFKPIDKEAQIIMKMQLEGEEKTMREMMNAMQKQALLEKAEADKIANISSAGTNQQKPDKASTTNHTEVR